MNPRSSLGVKSRLGLGQETILSPGSEMPQYARSESFCLLRDEKNPIECSEVDQKHTLNYLFQPKTEITKSQTGPKTHASKH